MDLTLEIPSENLINNVLIDDIFLIFFGRYFDAKRLLQLCSVCSKWKQLIEQTFASKRAVRLSESKDCFQSRQIYLAIAPQFKADFQIENIKRLPFDSAQSLGLQLSSAEKFAFHYSNDYSLIDVSPFFQTMTTLTAVILDRLPYNRWNHQNILSSLNGLPRLSKLHLCNMHEVQIPCDMPIFAQLEVFNLECYNNNNFSSLAAQLGLSLKKLKLLRTGFSADCCTQKQFPALRHLKLQEVWVKQANGKTPDILPEISKNLPLLESFYVRIVESYSFIAAMTSLSQMKHLKELSLLLVKCDDLLVLPKNLPSFPALKSLVLQFHIWSPSFDSVILDIIAQMCPHLVNFVLYDARLHIDNIAKIKNCVNLKKVTTICPEFNNQRLRFEHVEIVHKLRD